MASQVLAYILNIFRTMLPIKWIRCVLFPTLLFSSQQYPGADASGSSTNCRCCCIHEDNVYNLAPLQKDGVRLFEAVGTLNWDYGYSLCRSFSKDEWCPVGDVAVCRWDKNDPEGDHEVIGSQSTLSFTCDKDKPQLKYTAKENPDWKAIIRLECNPSLDKPDDAKFEVLQDNTTTYEFTLSHKCACPNGCPEEIPTSSPSQSTPPSTPVDSKPPITPTEKNLLTTPFSGGPPPSSPPSSSTATVIIGVLGSLLAVALCVFAVVLFRKRCTDDMERRRLIDQNGPSGKENLSYQSNNQSRHLADRENSSSQHQIDSFIKNPIGGKRSQSPSNNIRELKKDNVNKLNALS